MVKFKPYKKFQYGRLYEDDAQAQPAAAAQPQATPAQPAPQATTTTAPAQPAPQATTAPATTAPAAPATTTPATNASAPTNDSSTAAPNKFVTISQEMNKVLVAYITAVQQQFSSDAIKGNAPTMVQEMGAQDSPIKDKIQAFSQAVKALGEQKPNVEDAKTLTDAVTSINNVVSAIANVLQGSTEAMQKQAEAQKAAAQGQQNPTVQEALKYKSTFRQRLFEHLKQVKAEKTLKRYL